MRKSLYPRFLILFGAIVLISLFIAATLGSALIENQLIENDANAMYSEGLSLASGKHALEYNDMTVMPETYSILCTIASAEKMDIRIISTEGTVIFDTTKPFVEGRYSKIYKFDYAAFGPGRYEISNFFSLYLKDHLNVMIPITRNMKTIGYISLHRTLDNIFTQTTSLIRPLYIVVIAVLSSLLLILLIMQLSIMRPLALIKKGAREIEAGNLDHRITIIDDDEIGEVAASLNSLAAEIQKTSEYQRTFISNVSHDFRSPLTSIKGFTEAMIDGTIPPEMHTKYLHIIQSEADRLEKLTRNTLSLENLQRTQGEASPLSLSEFDINAVIKKTAAVFEGSCRPKKISISLIMDNDTLYVQADKERIQQVLYNLIDNAVKFSPDNSTITIETRLRHGKCETIVSDEGIGIAPDNLNKIWDRFYKTDSSRGKDKKGTGLGLSIVKEIIKAHNQTITVSSTENVGTRFVFTLALAK